MGESKNKNEVIKRIINILFVNSEEMQIKDIANILEIDSKLVTDLLTEIEESLRNVGLSLVHNNQKLSINTNPEYSDLLKNFSKYVIESDLTPAQLQTITILAYLESVTLSDISFIRGIQSVQTLRALTTKGLIEKENKTSSKKTPDSQKDTYVLTSEALQYMGITKNSELKDFEIIQNKLKAKMQEALNG